VPWAAQVDTSGMTLEQGLFRNFDDIVRRQLDAVWHTVSMRTKQARPHALRLCGQSRAYQMQGEALRGCALRSRVAGPWLRCTSRAPYAGYQRAGSGGHTIVACFPGARSSCTCKVVNTVTRCPPTAVIGRLRRG